LGCVRQIQTLSSVIMLSRGKARRWQAQQASYTSSRRTLPGAAESLGLAQQGPGSALFRPYSVLVTLKRAKADRSAIASQAFMLGLPRCHGSLIVAGRAAQGALGR
jgi:hypothetical protein